MTRSRTTRSHPIRALLPAVLCATLAALAGCSSSTAISTDTSPTTSPTASAASRQTVTVLAASSLTEPFAALATAYEQAHPDVTVRVSYGSSTTLAQQVTQGAPADIVALAGAEAVAALPAAATATHPPIPFAENALVLATPAANPARVGVLADLARPDVAVVLCVATAPCGRAADTALAGAGVTAHVVSREVDAKATLTKLRLGEADAALLYHSDVVAARGAVTGIPLPSPYAVSVTYSLVQLTDAPEVAGVVRALTDDGARTAYRAAGFGP
ncbi:MAG: molybdate ABC transporter substrate-binding protein [Actinomycetales bacterium]|nr:molybdate ABC transporter substrate-binding protein [Actinomycetales bacterium]